MDLYKLLEELHSFNLPSDEFAITSSGCLAVRGLREANDLDILVTDSIFHTLALSNSTKKIGTGAKIKLSKNIEVMGLFTDDPLPEEQINKADIIDGIRYVDLLTVRHFKLRDGRTKDLDDVRLIDNYLKQNALQK